MVKFKNEFIMKLTKQTDIGYRLLTQKDNLLDEDIENGDEGKNTIIRIGEDSNNPLDIYLTTKGNYKIYDKEGTLVQYVDRKYYDEDDLISFLKRY